MEYSTGTGAYEIFTEYLKLNFGENPSKLRGKLRGKLRRKRSEELMLMLLLIAIEKYIKATEASLILGVSTRTIETYISKLKDVQVIECHGWGIFHEPVT